MCYVSVGVESRHSVCLLCLLCVSALLGALSSIFPPLLKVGYDSVLACITL